MSLDSLQQRLGYSFGNIALLRQALTHRSHGQQNNERLEFLGDSVLNCVVSLLLYNQFGRIDEGDLSRLRSNLVKQQSLYEIAQRLELSQSLLLGEGELKSGGFRRPSILGDTLEAIFGAVFVDGGFDAAQRVIASLYAPVIELVDPNTLGKDAKTLLQEHLQGRKIPLPVYSVVATHGAAHSQLFEVECAIPKLGIQVLGNGGSRRAAEQAAAKLALEKAQSVSSPTVRRTRGKVAERVADKDKNASPGVSAEPPAMAAAPAAVTPTQVDAASGSNGHPVRAVAAVNGHAHDGAVPEPAGVPILQRTSQGSEPASDEPGGSGAAEPPTDTAVAPPRSRRSAPPL